jgi:hypothetical protein
MVLVAYAIGDNDAVDQNCNMVTTGYIEVTDQFISSGATQQDINLGVYYKFMPASPDATAVVDGLGGTDAGVSAVAMGFRGVDTAFDPDTTNIQASGIDTMHPNPPAITWGGTGTWVVIAGASGFTTAARTYTFPANYTVNAVQVGNATETSQSQVGLGYRTDPAATEDPGVMTLSGTDSANFCWVATTMEIREAPAAVPFPMFHMPDRSIYPGPTDA